MKTSNKGLLENLVSNDETKSDAPIPVAQPVGQPYAQSHKSPQYLELEDLHVSIGKRIYSQLNILVMFANTINAVFSISAAVSLIPQYDYSTYHFCSYGKPVAIGVQCPYIPSPVFISFLIAWTFYFIALSVFQFRHTYQFWSNDLRFYLACEQVYFEPFILIMVFIGLILTIVSGIGGIYFVANNGTTASIGNIFVFVAVNFVNLYSLAVGKYKNLDGVNIATKYKEPIPIELPMKSFTNLQGILVSGRALLEYLHEATLKSYVKSDDTCLQKAGDPVALKAVMLSLMPKELK